MDQPNSSPATPHHTHKYLLGFIAGVVLTLVGVGLVTSTIKVTSPSPKPNLTSTAPSPTSSQPQPADGDVIPTSQIYVSSFRFLISPDYKIVSRDENLRSPQDISEVRYAVPAGLGVYKRVGLPEYKFNLVAGVRASEISGKTASTCLSSLANSSPARFGKLSAVKASTGGAAAGTQIQTDTYRVYANSTCHELVFTIKYSSDYNAPGAQAVANQQVAQAQSELDTAILGASIETSSPPSAPTTGKNCRYQQVQCIQAPCDPVLVCD